MKPVHPTVKEPVVLVCHEKHGDVYFYVKDDLDLARVSYIIVRGRMDAGHWYNDPGPKPKKPDFSRDDVNKMPTSLQKDAVSKLNDYDRKLRRWKSEKDSWDAVKRAVSEKDGMLAWEILQNRSDGEYERVSLEHLSAEYR